jgi:hypothetical protein
MRQYLLVLGAALAVSCSKPATPAATAPAAAPASATVAAPAPAPATAPIAAPAPVREPATATAPSTEAAAVLPIPTDLKKVIDDSLALLEAGKYQEAIDLLAPPSVIASAQRENKLNELYARVQEVTPDLIAALKNAQLSNPTYNGDVIEYPAGGPIKSLRFTYAEGGWHIR